MSELKVGDDVFIYSSRHDSGNWITGKIERETKTQWIVKSGTVERRFYKEKRRYFTDENDFLQEVGAKTSVWALSYTLRPINEKTLKEYERDKAQIQRMTLIRDLQAVQTVSEKVSTERLAEIIKELKGD